MIFTKSKRGNIDLRNEIELKVQSGKTEELLLVVPTNRKSRYLKREMISASPDGAASVLNIETISTLAQKLLTSAETSTGRMLSDAASAVLLQQSIKQNKLRYFSNYRENIPAGTLERIKNVISEYKRHGIDPALVLKESDKLEGAEKLKALDIADIYSTYNQICRNVNYKEIGDIYEEINSLNSDIIHSSFRITYPMVNLMIIDGFDEFTTPEIQMIDSVSEIKNLDLYVQLDYYGLNENIFSHLDECYSKLLAKKFLIIEDKKREADDFRNIIRVNLFNQGRNKEEADNIVMIEAPAREQEVEFIAKEIKDLVSGGIEPGSICVVFNLIKNYSPIIRDIFKVYGLPFNLTDRKALALSSPVVTILNFLEIAENDYYYKNIFRALSSGYIRLKDINLSNLYSASANLKIISGFTNWVVSLKNEINRLEREDKNASSITLYRKALQDIQLLNSFLNPFYAKMSVKEFRDILVKTISGLNIHSEILNNNLDDIEENIKGLTEFIRTLDELFEILEKEEGNKKFPLRYFLNNIRTAVSGSRFNIKEKSGYGVQVTNLNEIRGLEFDYLFIGGLCDGDIPTRYKPEIFFSGSYVKNEKRHQTEERYHFYQSLCSWKKKLFLSYPLLSDNKEFVKSNILNEFGQLFSVKLKTSTDYLSKIYSQEELLNLAGTTPPSWKEIGIPFNNLKVNQAIGIDKLRKENPFDNSEYTGRILASLDQASREALQVFCRREFSVSQLELYAGCPFRYFVERVLQLNTLEEPAEEIEAKELGSLLHSILYYFYVQLNEKGIQLRNADDECFNMAEDLIFAIAEKEISNAVFSPLSFYQKEKILGINGKRKDSILYRFLLIERESSDNFIPSFFEVSFGGLPQEKSSKGESLTHFKAGRINVRGKIDRIDIDHESGNYKVVDYKSGSSKPSGNDISSGLSLQLPLYLIAARELIKLKLGKDYSPAGGEIYSLKYAEKDFKKNLVLKENAEMADACVEVIEKYVDSIAGGNFNLSELDDRENKICRNCSYRTVCRIDDYK